MLHSADMQFLGQTHILNVPLPSAHVSRAMLQELFEKAYFARFRVELPEIRANLVNLNTSVIGVRPAVDLSRLIDPAGRAATLDDARREMRPVWYDGAWLDTPVYTREKLPLDAVRSHGPAIIEQMDATTVLEPGDVATSDADDGNLISDRGGQMRVKATGQSPFPFEEGGRGTANILRFFPPPTPPAGGRDLDAITLSRHPGRLPSSRPATRWTSTF